MPRPPHSETGLPLPQTIPLPRESGAALASEEFGKNQGELPGGGPWRLGSWGKEGGQGNGIRGKSQSEHPDHVFGKVPAKSPGLRSDQVAWTGLPRLPRILHRAPPPTSRGSREEPSKTGSLPKPCFQGSREERRDPNPPPRSARLGTPQLGSRYRPAGRSRQRQPGASTRPGALGSRTPAAGPP